MKERNVTDAEQVDEIRKRIEKRYEKRQELMIHTASFLVSNIALWAVWGRDGWVWWVTVPWGIGLVAHFMDYYHKYGGGAERREAAINREVEREKERLGLYDKPKNDSRMRLSDDGEIEAVIEEDTDYTGEQQRRG